jgi:hypothetical protein
MYASALAHNNEAKHGKYLKWMPSKLKKLQP